MHGKGRAGRLGKRALLFLSGLVFVYACGRVGAVGSGSATRRPDVSQLLIRKAMKDPPPPPAAKVRTAFPD